MSHDMNTVPGHVSTCERAPPQDTRIKLEQTIDRHLRPTFGETKASKLTPEALELFYGRLNRCSLQCEGRLVGKPDPDALKRNPRSKRKHACRRLGPNSIRKLHFVLRAALGRAVRWGYIATNVATVAEPPSFKPTTPDPPSAAEAARVLNTAWARDLDWGTMLFLSMVTDCRRGELCGLRWRDVDFDTRILTVQHATRADGSLKDTKTHQHRRISFDEITADVLLAHHDRVVQRRTAFGGELENTDYVFSPDADGKAPPNKGTVSQRYRRLAKQLKLRSTRLQALRHYPATELIAAGVDLRTVSGRLGHGSGGATTLRVYAAWVPEADKRAATLLAPNLPSPATTTPPDGTEHPWQRIAAQLTEHVRSGTWAAGTAIPTIKELAATHGVSAGTAHRAVTQLGTDGLVLITTGRRTLVAPNQTRTHQPLVCACGAAGPWASITLNPTPLATCAACGQSTSLGPA